MGSLRRMIETVHLTVAGVWLGLLVATGVAAAIVFPAVKAIDPTLPRYAAYAEPHWMLGAGHVAERLFRASDVAQVALAGLAWLTLPFAGAFFGPRRTLAVVRIVLVAVVSGVVAWQLLSLRPHMDLHLAAYRAAAAAGDAERASEEREAFARLHPTASRALAVNAVLVLAVSACGAWDATRARTQEERARGEEA